MNHKIIGAGFLAGGLALAAAGYSIIKEKDKEHPRFSGVVATMGGIGLLITGLIMAMVISMFFFIA